MMIHLTESTLFANQEHLIGALLHGVRGRLSPLSFRTECATGTTERLTTPQPRHSVPPKRRSSFANTLRRDKYLAALHMAYVSTLDIEIMP